MQHLFYYRLSQSRPALDVSSDHPEAWTLSFGGTLLRNGLTLQMKIRSLTGLLIYDLYVELESLKLLLTCILRLALSLPSQVAYTYLYKPILIPQPE